MHWRKLNTVLHRDIGYLAVGLTIAYAVSGLAVNHRADWNPSYRVERITRQVAPIPPGDRASVVAVARQRLGLADEPRNSFRPDPDTLQLFYEHRTYKIDLPSGAVVVEATRHRPVLYEFNQLHLNTPKGLWTYVADLYALALITLSVTGMFVLRGRLGMAGRGAWLVGAGVLLPVVYWFAVASA